MEQAGCINPKSLLRGDLLMAHEHLNKSLILVIDDEKDILKALQDTLESEHFRVLTAMTGVRGIEIAGREKPDLILLDLRLTDMDGYDVCRTLKLKPETADIPIVMVSTRSKDVEKVVGLEIGADDYLTKPYSTVELLARVRVVFRRRRLLKEGLSASGLLRSGPVIVDVDGRSVRVEGKIVQLTRKEFDLLILFLSKPGRAFTRVALLESVWGYNYDSMNSTVDSHIKTLRKKLTTAGKLIETVTGVGYRWAAAE